MNVCYLIVFLLMCFTPPTFCTQAILEAIDYNDVERVENLIKKKQPFTKEQKATLLKAAQDTVKIYKKKTKSFLKSTPDRVRVSCGTLMSLIGIPISFVGCVGIGVVLLSEQAYITRSLVTAIVGVGLTVGGILQIYRGLTMYSAFQNLSKSREIEGIIQQASEK